MPIKTVPLFDDEIVGIEALARMAAALYGEEDPAQIYYAGKPQTLEGLPNGDFRLTIPLPFATKGDVTLRQTGDELFVHVGAHRRHIILPRALVGLRAARARMDDDTATLSITFEPLKS